MNTNAMINEEMELTIDNNEAGEEVLNAENLKMVYGGWLQSTGLYNVPCNVCNRYFAGRTVAGAEAALCLHTLTSQHRKNLRAHGYGYYHNLPFWS
jgi:hypothetical protein